MLAVPALEYIVDEAALVAAVASDVHLRVVSTLAGSSPIRTADSHTGIGHYACNEESRPPLAGRSDCPRFACRSRPRS